MFLASTTLIFHILILRQYLRYDSLVIRIGCTGGIAAGKSLFCSYLHKNGATVIDADALTHELLKYSKDLQFRLVKAFGDHILTQDAVIDRKKLAAAAFLSPDRKLLLESIVHPYLRNKILEDIKSLSAQQVPLLIIEGALLIETKAADFYDLQALIVVETPVDQAVERLRSIRKMTEDDIKNRISIQSSSITRIRSGDFIVINSGDKNLLEQMAHNVFNSITKTHFENASLAKSTDK